MQESISNDQKAQASNASDASPSWAQSEGQIKPEESQIIRFQSDQVPQVIKIDKVDGHLSDKRSNLRVNTRVESGLFPPIRHRTFVQQEQEDEPLETFSNGSSFARPAPSRTQNFELKPVPLINVTQFDQTPIFEDVPQEFRDPQPALFATELAHETEAFNKLPRVPLRRRTVSEPFFDDQSTSPKPSRFDKKLNDPAMQEATLAQTQKFQKKFTEQFPEIAHYIQPDKSESAFAQLWSKIILLTHTYNILTCFWYLAFTGFPTGVWFTFEVIAEMAGVLDFLFRRGLSALFPKIWQDMVLLHRRSGWAHITQRLIGSIPTSMIIAQVFKDEPAMKAHFGIACLRLLKLLRFRPFTAYFDMNKIKKNSQHAWIMRVIEVVYNFALGMHLICIFFCIPNRFQDNYGWFAAAKYYDFEVPNWQKYLDSMVYVISNMSGMGFGNIVPITNGEWVVAIFIFMVGSSIYLNYYAQFAFQVQQQHYREMENTQKLEECKKLAQVRHLPDQLRSKIRYYFKTLRLKFEDFKQKREIVDVLPFSLKDEMALQIHQELIHNVNFFQFSNVDFISRICHALKPKICIINEYVFHRDEMASKMYFIQSGVCEVESVGSRHPLKFMTKGGYFGEIGVLLTGKRTCSVVVRTTTILQAIKKEDLDDILQAFPTNLKFLTSVGKQRIQVQRADEISNYNEKAMINDLLNTLPQDENVFGNLADQQNLEENQSLYHEFIKNDRQLKEQRFAGSTIYSDRSEALVKLPTFAPRTQYAGSKVDTKRFWHTAQFKPDVFLIVPFSPAFLLWNSLLCAVIFYDLFMIPYCIGLDYELQGVTLVLDSVCIFVHAVDMLVRARTAITVPSKYCFEPERVLQHYFNSWLILDCFVVIPFAHIVGQTSDELELTNWARAFRLLKFGRLLELFYVVEVHSDVRKEFYSILRLFLMFGFMSHLTACGFAYFGYRGYQSDQRFDGQNLFEWTETRPYAVFGKMSTLSKWEVYKLMAYLGACIQGASIYGDMVPLTPLEEIWDLLAQVLCRVLWAFIIAECASYLGSLYEARATQIQKLDRVIEWMKESGFHNKVISRYSDYEQVMWNHFQGIDEEAILSDLPRTLRQEIRSFTLSGLIKNWEAFPDGSSHSAIWSVIRKLKFVVYPANEVIITAGEIGHSMYFIIKGTVHVRGTDGNLIAILAKGQNFGEMALINNSSPIRTADVISITHCSLAMLSFTDFKNICKVYPQFRLKMVFMAKIRKEMNKQGSILSQSALEEAKLTSPQTAQARRATSSNASVHIGLQNTPPRSPPTNLLAQALNQIESAKASELRRLQPNQKKPSQQAINPQNEVNLRPAGTMDQHLFTQPNENDDQANFVSVSESSIDESSNRDAFESQSPLPKQLPVKLKRDSVSVTAHFSRLQRIFNNSDSGDKLQRVFRVVQILVLVLSVYNMIFIPLQFGFRIEFKGIFLAMEIFTISVYLIEIGMRIMHLKSDRQVYPEAKDSQAIEDTDQLRAKQLSEKREILITITSVIPFSLLSSLTKWYEPFPVLVFFCSLRMLKMRPVAKFWRWCQQISLNVFRVFEVVFYYYLALHWFSGVMIGFAIFEPDHRLTWLARVPSPQPNGVRATPSIWDDISPLILYNHAQNFQINTFSHLAIGDVSMCTINERFFLAFNIWVAVFIYNLLYGNITAIVANIGTGQHIEFFKDFNNIVKKIKNGKVSNKLLKNIKLFFDYQWFTNRGMNFNKLRQLLPESIFADMALSFFADAIEKSMLFRDEDGNIDVPLAISTFKQMEFLTFLPSDFIIKLGQHSTETYFLLEGELQVYGINDNELLGYLTAGSHLGLELSNDFQEREELCNFSERIRTKFKMDSASDNFDNKYLGYVAANSHVTVGVLTAKQRRKICKSFPEFKKRMQLINRAMFQLFKASLERYTDAQNKPLTKLDCKQMMIDHLTFTSISSYERIITNSQSSPNNDFDLTQHLKAALFATKIKTAAPQFVETMLEPVPRVDRYFFNEEGDLISTSKSYWLAFEHDSKVSKIFKCVQFLNLLYISIACPLTIGFDIRQNIGLMVVDSLSIAISFAVIIIKLRTYVLIKGRKSIDFKVVLKQYYKKGLILDLFGILPFKLVLYSSQVDREIQTHILLSVLSLARMVSVWRTMELIQEFEIYMNQASYYVRLAKAVLMFFIPGHWIACTWFFLCLVVERDRTDSWIFQQNLQDKPTLDRYIRSYYLTINIATSVGSGDMYPNTELERFAVTIMMTVGDVLWSFGFGLIIQFWQMSKEDDSHKAIFDQKMGQVQQFIERQKVSIGQKQRMEKYFAYQFYHQQKSSLIDKQELLEHLPTSMVQNIVVQTNRELLEPMFRSLKSDNMIHELCLALEGQIYLPQDFIISKGEVGDEMYFIVEGSVHVIAGDKMTIVKTLNKGQYFGEIAIFFSTKRVAYVQAATFCLVNRLKKKDLDKITDSFPQIAEDLARQGQLRKAEIEALNRSIGKIGEDDNELIHKMIDESMNFDEKPNNTPMRTQSLHSAPIELIKAQSAGLVMAVAEHSEARLSAQNLLDLHKNVLINNLNDSQQKHLTQIQSESSPTPSNGQANNQLLPRRRLSGITLGKQLILSNQSGFKFQWNADH